MLLGPSSNGEDSNDNSSNHSNNIQIDDIQKLLEHALKNENFTDILRRVFPQLSLEEALKIEANAAKVFEKSIQNTKTKQDKSEEESYFFHKLSFAITMTVIGSYFGGPIAASCSSSLFTKVYTVIFGVPNSDSLLYGMFFSPCQKFLKSASNQYGAYFVGTLAATTSYGTANAVEYLGNKIQRIQKWFYKSKTTSPQNEKELLEEFELMMITDAIDEVKVDIEPKADNFDDDSFIMILPGYESKKKSKKETKGDSGSTNVYDSSNKKNTSVRFTSLA